MFGDLTILTTLSTADPIPMSERPMKQRDGRTPVQALRLGPEMLALGLASLFLLHQTGCQNQTSSEKAQPTNRHHESIERGSDDVLQRGVDYLMAQQSDDGRWRSDTYGNLKDGAAITAFVLYALPNETGKEATIDKALLQNAVDALVPQIRQHGYVTNPDGPDYTNYGTALLLLACQKHNLKLDAELKARLVQYLVRSQLDGDEGFANTNPDYGGWDLSGWMTGQRPTTGSTISVTTSVVQALNSIDGIASDKFAQKQPATIEAIRNWITKVRNDDGGFFFHPRKDHDGNKAAWSDGNERQQTRSYGSATADGLRLLVYSGKGPDDPDVQAAIAWLLKHQDLEKVPGFEHETGQASWAVGLRYYYYQSLCHSLDLFPEQDARRIAGRLHQILEREQKSDGSWQNPNARMREDDPLIATGFAILALQKTR